MKKLGFYIIVLSIIFTVSACGNDSADEAEDKQEKQDKQAEQGTEQADGVKVEEDEKVEEDKIVANINGVDITGEAYNLVYVQTKAELLQVGQDVNDQDLMKETALDALVGQEILVQEAKELGINIGEDELEEEFKTFKSENEEQFTALLDEYQLSENAFKDQLHFSLMYEEYLEMDLPEIEVTNDEVKEMYEGLKEENKEIPEFEVIEDQLKNGLKQEKVQTQIEKLKEKAEIETMI